MVFLHTAIFVGCNARYEVRTVRNLWCFVKMTKQKRFSCNLCACMAKDVLQRDAQTQQSIPSRSNRRSQTTVSTPQNRSFPYPKDDLFYRFSNGSPQGRFEPICRSSLLVDLPATGQLQQPTKHRLGGHHRWIGCRRRRHATTGNQQDPKLLEIRQDRRQGNRRKIRSLLAPQHYDLVVSKTTAL